MPVLRDVGAIAATELPARIGDLFEREERMVELPGDYAAIADYVADHAVARG